MKVLITVCLLLITQMSMAQSGTQLPFKLGIKGGLNATTITNAGVHQKLDFHFGIFTEFHFNSFSFEPEILYSRQGCTTDFDSYTHFYDANSRINLSYLTFPLIIKVFPVKSLNIHFGIQPGILLSGSEKGEWRMYKVRDFYEMEKMNVSIMKDYKDFDFGIPIGLGYNFTPRLNMDIRYIYGTKDMNGSGSIRAYRETMGKGSQKMSNRTMQFSVGYLL